MIKVSLVLLAGLLASALLRRRSAALRHAILAATIASAAALPALELVVPAWQLPLDARLLRHSVEPLTLILPIGETSSVAPAIAVKTAAVPAASRLTAVRLLGWTWLTGVAVSLGILAIGLCRLAWFAARATHVEPGPWTELADRLSSDYGLARRVRLLQSDHPTLLGTWGLRQATIILPNDSGHWPASRIRVVLAHELAHIQRHDWLMQMAAEALRAVYWFNPLTWIAVRRLHQESEQACDDAVLRLGVEGHDYASHLLDVARQLASTTVPVFPAPAMARPSSLERRVRAMLNTHLSRTPVTRASSLAVVVALMALTVPIAGIVSAAQTGAASFSGTLVDAVGRVLPNVEIVLTNGTAKYQGKSGADGRFSIAPLAAGDYKLEVGLLGFDRSRGRVTLAAGQALTRDVALQIGGIMETVTVSSRDAATPPRRGQPRDELPATDRCSQTGIGGCINPPKRISDARPVYPQVHRATGVEGTVKVDGRIGTDGFIKNMRVDAPADPDFASAAVDALREWQFTATRLDGVPVEANIQVIIKFVN